MNEKILAGYNTAITSSEKIEQTILDLKRQLKNQLDLVSVFDEERRREHDKIVYDLNVQRQILKDTFTNEDRFRDLNFKTRTDELKNFQDELCSLLGLVNDVIPTTKQIRASFESKIVQTDKAGEARGLAIAKKEYETSKKLDEAGLSKDFALLKQENEQLKLRNVSLEKQINELLANQQAVVGHMKDLGVKALEASAGVQGKAVDSLQTAASAGSQKQTR